MPLLANFFRPMFRFMITPDEISALRAQRGENQAAFAAWLADKTGTGYRQDDVSKWERGIRQVPAPVEIFLLREALAAWERGQKPLLTVL